MSETTTQNLHEQVCEEIRVMLVRRRISQAEVARRAGWTPFYLSNRLNGKTPMNVNDLEALSKILGVEPTSFFPSGRSLSGGDINLRKCPFPRIYLGDRVFGPVPARRKAEFRSPFENRTLDTMSILAA